MPWVQGRVTAALREKALWDHTLVIFHAGELRTQYMYCAGSPLADRGNAMQTTAAS